MEGVGSDEARDSCITTRPADSSSAVDRTCPVCERQETLVPFGIHQNLQPWACGGWRLVTVEIAQCRQRRVKILESMVPEVVPEVFWRRVARR
jgi:hypothetical protein